jgi:hypothetical protein
MRSAASVLRIVALFLVSSLGSPAVAQSGARELADAWLSSKGAGIGYDPVTHAFITIQSASVGVPPSAKDYPERRDAACRIVLNSARDEAIRFLQSEIRSSIGSKDQLLAILGDEGLAAAAGAVTGPVGGDRVELSREQWSQVEVIAQAAVSGLAPWQTFETADPSGAQVAVVAALSPKYAAALAGRTERVEPGPALRDWVKSLDDAALASTFGGRIRRDERGALCAVGFGQARIRPGMEDHAFDEAERVAQQVLAHICAEQAASRVLQASRTLQSESNGASNKFASVSEFERFVQTNANLVVPGVQPIGRRSVQGFAGSSRLAVVACAVEIVAPPASLAGGAVATTSNDCPPISAELSPHVIQIRASGTGKTKAEALEAALFDAVRQQGAMVKGDSTLEKKFSEQLEAVGEEVRSKAQASTRQDSRVQTFAKGFIHSYRVTSADPQDGLFTTEICANIIRFDPKDPRFGGRPTVAVLPFTYKPASIKVAGSAVDGGAVAQIPEAVFERVLDATNRYELIDERSRPELRRVREDILARVADGRSEAIEAVKLGHELTADFVLVGVILGAEYIGQPGDVPQSVAAADNASATISARLVNVASGEIVWSGSMTDRVMGRQILLARAGRDLKDPSERSLSPLALGVSRVSTQLAESMRSKISAAAAGPELVPAGSR